MKSVKITLGESGTLKRVMYPMQYDNVKRQYVLHKDALRVGLSNYITDKGGRHTCCNCPNNISGSSGTHRRCSSTNQHYDIRRCPLNKAINAKMEKGTWTWIQK